MVGAISQPLRVGILAAGPEIEAWACAMLEEVAGSEYARIEVLAQGDQRPEKTGLVHGLFSRLDDKLFHPKPNALERRSILEVEPDLPVVSIVDRPGSASVSAEALRRLKELDLDVLIDVGLGVCAGPLLQVAKFGLWSCDRPDSWGAQGVREVLKREPETTVAVRMLRGGVAPAVLLASIRTSTDRLSAKRNRNAYCWNAATLFPRTLKKLWELGETEFFRVVGLTDANPIDDSTPVKGSPGNLRMTALVARLYWRKVMAELRRRTRREPWALFYKFGREEVPWESLSGLQSIEPPNDRFWADPHVVEHQGSYHIFIEEYLYDTGLGRISVMEIDSAGRYTQPRVALDGEHHLSYPFVFKHAGEFYMIPETLSKRRIELYRCLSYPDEWTLATVLMENVDAVDATVIFRDGKWWLFTSIKEREGQSVLDELFLFYTDDLLTGDWAPSEESACV